MVVRSEFQRCLPLQSIFDVGLGSLFDQNLAHLWFIGFCSMVQRRPAIVIQAIDFGTIIDELRDHQDLVVLHKDSMMKRISPSMILHVNDVDVVLRQKSK